MMEIHRNPGKISRKKMAAKVKFSALSGTPKP
jgi:hypothetical protein